MYTFNVTIRTGMERYQWILPAMHPVDLVNAAIDMFGPCAVRVVMA